MKIGVLSDTHGYLDPEIPKLFKGVRHILHAGDIGYPSIILELQEIAPVTAVRGNCDDPEIDFKELEVVTIDIRKFILQHIVNPAELDDRLKRRVIRENPDFVIFGHTHQKFIQMIGQTLFFNPGYAGKPKKDQVRSVAILNCDDAGITADHIELP